MLGRALLTLDNGKPLPAMDAPVGVNLTVKRNCGAGCKSLSVDADGTIYPCHMLHRPELAMGNAFTAPCSMRCRRMCLARSKRSTPKSSRTVDRAGICESAGEAAEPARCSNRAIWSRRTPTA